MTPRERVLATINHKKSDYVPCAPWHNILFPSEVLGIRLDDLSSALATYPIWKATLETDKKFGFTSNILSPLCLGGGEFISYSKMNEDIDVNQEIFEREETRFVEITISTPAGKLREERICPQNSVDAPSKYLIKDPREDYEKVRYIIPDPSCMDFSKHLKVQKEVGDRGVVRLGFDTPWTWWITHRGQAGYIDHYDCPDILDRFYEDYLAFVIKYIRISEKYKPDIYWIHGVYDGFIGMDIADRYVYRFIREIRRHTNVPLAHFISGKVSRFLEREAEAGVDILEPLEPFPLGDIDLADAKRRIGNTVCLSGNLDPVNILERGTPKDIEREVKKCIDAAAEGGGYIFSTADQITNFTPFENIYAMVEAVQKYGKY